MSPEKNENFRLTAIPDTRAEVTICSSDVIQKMKIPRKEIKQSSNYKLIAKMVHQLSVMEK